MVIFAVGVTASAGLLTAAEARDILGELQGLYPCPEVEVTYGYLSQPVSVGLEFDSGFRQKIVFDEEKIFAEDMDVVSFEYISACLQADTTRGIALDPFKSGKNRSIIFQADCRATEILQRQGIWPSTKSAFLLFEEFQYGRGDEAYYNVSFKERAENIQHCLF